MTTSVSETGEECCSPVVVPSPYRCVCALLFTVCFVLAAWIVVLLVAVFTASFSALRLAIPTSPPLKYPPSPAAVPPAPRAAPPTAWPDNPANADSPRVAIRASASSDFPALLELTPRLARKASILCETFKKATAQRNHIRTFPTTASLPDAETSASTSASVIARTGKAKSVPSKSDTANAAISLLCFFVLIPPIIVIKDLPKKFQPST